MKPLTIDLLASVKSNQYEQRFCLPNQFIIVQKLQSLDQVLLNILHNYDEFALLITPTKIQGLKVGIQQLMADTIDWLSFFQRKQLILPKLIVVNQVDNIFVNLNIQLQYHIITLLQQMSPKIIFTISQVNYNYFKSLQSFNKLLVFEQRHLYFCQADYCEQIGMQSRYIFSKFWDLIGIE